MLFPHPKMPPRCFDVLLFQLLSPVVDDLMHALAGNAELPRQVGDRFALRMPRPNLVIALALGRRMVGERSGRHRLSDVHVSVTVHR